MINQKELKMIIYYCHETGSIKRIDRENSEVGNIVHISGKRYVRVYLNGRQYYAHHLAWLYTYGYMPNGSQQIDHIDGNGINNRLYNLRVCDQKQNMMNRRLPANNKSGVIGVHFDKKSKKWMALIVGGGERKYLGSYETLDEAKKARRDAEILYKYHPNHGSERSL